MKSNTFIQDNEFYGREALKDLVDLKLFPNYEIHYTPESCVYDAYFINKKRVFIEIKVRYETYGDYMLESKKVKNIKQVIDDLYLDRSEVSVLYINFCPTSTHIWDVTDYLYENIEWSKKDFNEATFKSRTNKKEKNHVMLLPQDGKTIKYKINRKYLLDKYNAKYNPKPTPKPGIFD